MTVAHADLTGSDLHEPKGIGAATSGQVYAADGAGSGTWAKLTHSNLQTTGNPFGAQLFHVREQQSNGVASTLAMSGNNTWYTRILNTSVTNEITSASLGSNRITLPAGTYHVWATAGFRATSGTHKLRLRNITDGSTAVVGMNHLFGSATFGGSVISLSGRLTIAGSKSFELQHYVTGTTSAQGFGDVASSGEVEVYADALVWKIA